MIRKLILAATVAAVPLGALATGAIASSPAGATGSLTCAASGTVTFASPGISADGTVTTAKSSSSTTSSTSFTGCSNGDTGSTTGRTIVAKNSKCTGANTPVPGCVAKEYYYDTVSGLTSGSNLANIQKALKSVTLTLGTTTYSGKTTSVTSILGGACGSEAGFGISGTIKKAAYTTFTLDVCLGHDTGTGTTGSFIADVGSETGGDTGITIATASIDPSQSLLTLS